MKVNVGLILQLRNDKAWSQDELAMAAGLNLRTIQRIEKEATASLQSLKALASAFDMSIHDLKHEETEMINELLGKDVVIVMGISDSKLSGFDDSLKGQITEIDGSWMKLTVKNKPVYINITMIKRIIPQ
ncbi:MAG: helix-turn-helix transcriptional regulator [Pseudomonadota bacterium]